MTAQSTTQARSWRDDHSAETASPKSRQAVEYMGAGLSLKPDILCENGRELQRTTLPSIIEGVVSELGRRHHGVAIYACAVWREENETMVTTSSAHFPDGKPELRGRDFAATHHFAHLALEDGGMLSGANLEQPYPTPWPDAAMGGRPSMPHESDDWMVEQGTVISWFDKLWDWHGGAGRIDWSLLMEDINSGQYNYIEAKRLPKEYGQGGGKVQLRLPSDWDKSVTFTWTRHIRSTMDRWGRVLPDQQATAICFRRVDDAAGKPILHEGFIIDPWHDSNISWSAAELLYERSVLGAINAAPAASDIGTARAGMLYDGAKVLVEQVLKHVPTFGRLWQQLREYESVAPLEAACISNEQALKTNWPAACEHVERDPARFASNFDPLMNTYPETFVRRTETGHSRFEPSRLRDWLAEGHFRDRESGMILGGTNGICVGFYAIAHTAINISRVMPQNREEFERLDEEDKRIYLRGDYRLLEQCVKVILDQVDMSFTVHRTEASALLKGNQSSRYTAWAPGRWLSRSGNGHEVEQPANGLVSPKPNLFDATWLQYSSVSAQRHSSSAVPVTQGNDTTGNDATGTEDTMMTDLSQDHGSHTPETAKPTGEAGSTTPSETKLDLTDVYELPHSHTLDLEAPSNSGSEPFVTSDMTTSTPARQGAASASSRNGSQTPASPKENLNTSALNEDYEHDHQHSSGSPPATRSEHTQSPPHRSVAHLTFMETPETRQNSLGLLLKRAGAATAVARSSTTQPASGAQAAQGSANGGRVNSTSKAKTSAEQTARTRKSVQPAGGHKRAREIGSEGPEPKRPSK